MTETYEFRPASQDDFDSVVRWLREEAVDPKAKFSFLENVMSHDPSKMTVAVHGTSSQIVGFLVADRVGASRRAHAMEVKAHVRRGGVGERLVEDYLAEVRRSGALGVLLECNPKSSIPFWTDMGSLEVNERLDPMRVNGGHGEHYRYFCIPTVTDVLPEGEACQLTVKLCNGAGECLTTPWTTEGVVDHSGAAWLGKHFVSYALGEHWIEVRRDEKGILRKKVMDLGGNWGAERDAPFVRISKIDPSGRGEPWDG